VPTASATNTVKIVGASAMTAMVFGKVEAISVRLEGARLLAPSLLDFEMARICLKKLRYEKTQCGAILSVYARRDSIRIRRVPVDYDDVVEFAIQAGITAYDASYLWLARLHKAELVSLDKRLNKVFLSDVGR